MIRCFRCVAVWIVAATAGFALVPGLVREAAAQAGARVAEIDFRGNRRYDAETLRLSLRTKRGQPFDESLLNEDVKTLYGLFVSVQVEKKQEGEQVRITFVVSESDQVADVVLRGVSGLSESDVQAVVDTAKGRPLAEFRVDNDAKKIERLYRMRGYHFVEVKRSVTDGEGGKVVTFDVLEGPKVRVDSLTFVGNENLPRSKLTDWMATQESGFLGLRGADYVEETLVKDRSSLVNLYRTEGFFDVEVSTDVTFSGDRRKAFVVVTVREGRAFSIGKLAFAGVERYPGGEEALRPLLTLESGTRFRSEEVRRSRDAVERAYHEEGFFSVNVAAEERPVGGVVDLTFRVDEQSKVRVRNVFISGNEVTQDKVIRREISVFPGEVLNQNEIDKSVRRLRGLGYFTNVKADVAKLGEGDDPNLRDVRFDVDDTAKTGQVRFAVGASSDLGLLGSFTVTKRNFDWRDWPERFGDVFTGRAFTGAGQTFQLEVSPGSSLSTYRIAFTEPWLFDKPISFGWDLFFSKFTRFDYDVDRSGLDLTLGRRFTFEGRRLDTVVGIAATTRLERVDLSNVHRSSAPTAFLAEGDNSLLAERFAFRIDRIDQVLAPTEGWYAQLTPEVGFAGDIRLLKTELEARRYWTVWTNEEERKHTLSVGAQAGRVRPLSSSVEAEPNVFDTRFVPTYERFFAGGSTTIRGFAFGGAGPHGEGNPFLPRRDIGLGKTVKSVLENDGDPMGGDVAVLANAEYGFPLYEELLRGVLFVDAGIVRDSVSSSHGLDRDVVDRLRARLAGGNRRERRLARQFVFDDGPAFWSDTRVAVGFGLRIQIPGFGTTPIALDFGFPVRRRSGDDVQILSFSIERGF